MKVMLTGGSACGKSTFGETLAMELGSPRVYIATMRPYGEEGLAKIARHRKMREPKGFSTIERQTDLGEVGVDPSSTVLLECVCNLMSNEMFDEDGTMHDVWEKVVSDILDLAGRCENIIVITNDVGSEYLDAYDDGTAEYARAIGRANIELAKHMDCVCELVCGIPIVISGALPEGMAR